MAQQIHELLHGVGLGRGGREAQGVDGPDPGLGLAGELLGGGGEAGTLFGGKLRRRVAKRTVQKYMRQARPRLPGGQT